MIPEIPWLADAPTDTFGVEEEFYLVDAMTGELADRAREVIGPDDEPDLETEILRCSVESSTPACRAADECRSIVQSQRAALVARADALGLELHAAGVPPTLARDEIAARVDPLHHEAPFVARVAAIAETDIFACHGIHVHVGIGSFEAALTVLDAIAAQLPLLTAITANSRDNAFGADCASLRGALLGRSPLVGMVPRFDGVDDLVHATLESAPDRSGHPRPRWLIAPVPHYGTVEVRAFDSHADARVAVEVALLLRAIADAALRGAALPRPSEWIERKNLRHAFLHGSAATFIDGDQELQDVPGGWSKLLDLVSPFLDVALPALTALSAHDASTSATRIR